MTSHTKDLLAACIEGDLKRVRDMYEGYSSPPDGLLDNMMLKAAEKGHADIVQYCIEKGAEVSDEVITEATDFPEVFKVLVTKGGLDVNEGLGHAGDMLVNAVWEQKLDFTKWLLEHGANTNSGRKVNDSTALTAAAHLGNLNLAKLLVQYGAEVSGYGALPAAAGEGHVDMVRWLLDRGADIDEVGVHGDRRLQMLEGTALHIAVAKGNVGLAKLLVDRGARTDVKDLLGRTPFQRAKDDGQDKTMAFLVSIGVVG